MRVKHTIAAALAGMLLVHRPPSHKRRDPVVRTIPREEALRVLRANLRVGADFRVQLANGGRVEGASSRRR